MCVDFSTLGLRIRCSQVTFSVGSGLGLPPQSCTVGFTDRFPPPPGFTDRFGLPLSAPSPVGLVLCRAPFDVTALAFYLASAITAGALLPYRCWGTFCAYRCRTIVGGWYLCFSTAGQALGALYLCLLAVQACRGLSAVLLLLFMHSYAINVCGSLCVTSA